MPTPHNFRELGQSSALATRTSKVDSNGRALLKFDSNDLRTFFTHDNGKAEKMHHPQSQAFAASFRTYNLDLSNANVLSSDKNVSVDKSKNSCQRY